MKWQSDRCVCVDRAQIFSMPHDEVGMLLMGANSTDNQLHNDDGDGYRHICEAFDVQCTSWHMMRMLDSQIEAGRTPGRSDWLDAIVVALDMLNRHR